MPDIEDLNGLKPMIDKVPVANKRKREDSPKKVTHKTWREALGPPPSFGTTKVQLF